MTNSDLFLYPLSLRSYSPNLSNQVLEALATDGILDNRSNQMKQLTENERDARNEENEGIKCP